MDTTVQMTVIIGVLCLAAFIMVVSAIVVFKKSTNLVDTRNFAHKTIVLSCAVTANPVQDALDANKGWTFLKMVPEAPTGQYWVVLQKVEYLKYSK